MGSNNMNQWNSGDDMIGILQNPRDNLSKWVVKKVSSARCESREFILCLELHQLFTFFIFRIFPGIAFLGSDGKESKVGDQKKDWAKGANLGQTNKNSPCWCFSWWTLRYQTEQRSATTFLQQRIMETVQQKYVTFHYIGWFLQWLTIILI